jgi:hypothetical protein
VPLRVRGCAALNGVPHVLVRPPALCASAGSAALRSWGSKRCVPPGDSRPFFFFEPLRLRALCALWVSGAMCHCGLDGLAPSRIGAARACTFALGAVASLGAARHLGFRRDVLLGTQMFCAS